MTQEIATFGPSHIERKTRLGLIEFLLKFTERNLFERIIIYIFLAALIVKIVFEFLLGEWSYVQSQNKQWIFYGFLALDYLFSVRKVVGIKVTLNMMSLYALIMLIMIAQGLFVGIVNHNQPFVIFNDTVPLLMIALNILRFQSLREYKPIDFEFLLKACTILSIGTCVFGLVADLSGKPSSATVGNGSIYWPLVLSAIFLLRPFPSWVGLSAFIMLALSVAELNRTTIAFLGGTVSIYVALSLVSRPARGLVFVIVCSVLLILAWVNIPENSGTYRRIIGLYDLDMDSRTGSLGERQAEMEAVQFKLDTTGPAAQWLGLGFGGLYEVQHTQEYLTEYGHAHYSWVWYNLRFGRIGYIYLFIMVTMLLYNAYKSLRKRTPTGVFTGLLCINSLIFCVTYVNSVFLISGITYFHDPEKEKHEL